MSTIIPLYKAVLCPNCGAVSDGIHNCPACAGVELLNLQSVLDRKPVQRETKPRLRVGTNEAQV